MLWSQITQATIAVIGSHLMAGTDLFGNDYEVQFLHAC